MKEFLYDKVAKLVSDMIKSGTLKPGERIPSLRKMSKKLNVSIATVTQAYVYLEDLGQIESRPASGYYVRHNRRQVADLPHSAKPLSLPRNIEISNTIETVFSLSKSNDIVPLGIAQPDPLLLPSNSLAKSTRLALSRYSKRLHGYGPQEGTEELRRQIAFRSADISSLVEASEVLITNGATEALTIALKAVAKPGDSIAVQTPVYFGILQVIKSCGMLSVEIESSIQTGVNLDSLEQVLLRQKISAVVLVPNFNNPTGSLMPNENKARLVELLDNADIPLIEDDAMGDLYFGDTRPVSCKKFDRKNQVISIGSFSKSLSPGYHVGWLFPGRYYIKALQQKLGVSSCTSTLTQYALAEYLVSGHYDHHLMRLRRSLREQVSRLSNTVLRCFPVGTRMTHPSGGMVLWIQPSVEYDSLEVYNQALSIGTSFTPGELFSARPRYDNYMRLCAGQIWSDRMETAVKDLGKILAKYA